MKARVFLSLALALPAAAHSFTVQMMHVTPEGIGQLAGTVVIEDSAAGARLTPDLRGLPPGPHGFHLHQNGDCGPTVVDGKATPAGAAGGHWDPAGHGHHLGPQLGHAVDKGHQGDLPRLEVSADGSVRGAVVAPRLKASDFKGRSLMIHAGGDNYSDTPAPLGGGGARIVCGVVR